MKILKRLCWETGQFYQRYWLGSLLIVVSSNLLS